MKMKTPPPGLASGAIRQFRSGVSYAQMTSRQPVRANLVQLSTRTGRTSPSSSTLPMPSSSPSSPGFGSSRSSPRGCVAKPSTRRLSTREERAQDIAHAHAVAQRLIHENELHRAVRLGHKPLRHRCDACRCDPDQYASRHPQVTTSSTIPWDFATDDRLLEVQNSVGRVVTSIPPSAQSAFMDAVQLCFARMIQFPQCYLGWRMLCMLPALLLRSNARGGGAAKRDVQRRCREFNSGGVVRLYHEFKNPGPKCSTTKQHQPLPYNIRKACSFAGKGLLSRASKSLDALPPAPRDGHTVDKLRMLHPDEMP